MTLFAHPTPATAAAMITTHRTTLFHSGIIQPMLFTALLMMFSLPALAGGDDLELHVEPVDVPAVVEVPLDDFLWVNIDHPDGEVKVVGRVLGPDNQACESLRSPSGFKPSNAAELWSDDLLGYAVVEITGEAVLVDGRKVVTFTAGRIPDRYKRGLVVGPLLDRLLAHRTAQYQFRIQCEDPAWSADGTRTAASSEALLVAVAADVPFDIVREVLHTARKSRFTRFYLYARSRKTTIDPLAPPPTSGDTDMLVFVASDGGLGIDRIEEGKDSVKHLLEYLPRASDVHSARVVPFSPAPWVHVIGAAGALVKNGWHPAIAARLDSDEMRASRVPPIPRSVTKKIGANRSVQAIPVTLPESGDKDQVRNRTRFSISGATSHVAIFTPPAHVADALQTPEVGTQLKHVLTCYRDEESDSKGLQGELVLQLVVNPNGTVKTTRILPTSTLTQVNLTRCVVDEFASMTLPGNAVSPDPMLWRVQFLPRAPGTQAKGTEAEQTP